MMDDCARKALDPALGEIRTGAPCAAPHKAAQTVIDRAGDAAAFRKRID